MMAATEAQRLKEVTAKTTNLWAWKTNVMLLLPGAEGYRDTKIMSGYNTHWENFQESVDVGSWLLLTKRRHKAFNKTWDGTGSDTCSEEFYQLLDAQSDSETDEHGEPRVWKKDIDKVEHRVGKRSSCAELEVRPPPDGGHRRRSSDRPARRSDKYRESAASEASASNRSRTPRGSARQSDQRSQSRPNGSLEASFAASSAGKETRPRWREGCVLSPSPPPPNATLRRAASQRAAKSPDIAEAPDGLANASRYDGSNGSGKAETVARKAYQAALDADTTSFLARRKQLKKELEEKIRKAGLKTSIHASLRTAIGKLNAEQLKALRKTGKGDYELLLTSFDTCQKDHDSLLEELDDADAAGLAGWEEKLATAGTIIEDLQKRGGLGPYGPYKDLKGPSQALKGPYKALKGLIRPFCAL